MAKDLIQYPTEPVPPVLDFSITDGYRCKYCRFLYRVKSFIEAYVRSNYRKDSSSIPLDIEEGVKLQTLFRSKSACFPVFRATAVRLTTSMTWKNTLLYTKKFVQFDPGDLTPWMETTGIARHLRGRDQKALRNMTAILRLKDGDELRPVMRALEEIFQDAINICKGDGNNYLLRR